MSPLLDMALANLIVAALLAFLAALAGLWGRRPAVTHALWLLVLVKLITPPFFEYPVPWSAPTVMQDEPIALARFDIEPARLPVAEEVPEIAPPPEPIVLEDAFVPAVLPDEIPPIVAVEPPPVAPVVAPVALAETAGIDWPWLEIVFFAWSIGSCIWLTLALWRLWRFQRLLRFAQPAPAFVRDLAHELADCLHVRCPDVGVIPGNVSPLLWTLGRKPRLILPAGLLERMPADQLATLLAHELAHWRRRDDRIRWLEFVVLALYWWCPLVWWARRELHQAEEECCDAWVVAILPDSAKTYALALVETVDFLSEAPADLPLVASGLGRVRLLKRRLTMILQGKTPRALTLSGLLGVAGVGLLLLPLVPGWAQSQQREQQQRDEQGQRETKKGERPGTPNRQDQLDMLRDQVQRLQHEMEKRQQEMHARAQELQQMIQQLRKAEGSSGGGGGGGGFGIAKKGGQGGPPVGPGAPGGQGGQQGGPGGGERKGGAGGPPGFPAGGGGFGGSGSFPGGAGGFAFGSSGPGNPLDKRITEVERKIDTLLQELRALRGEMNRGPKGPPVPPVPPVPPRPGFTPKQNPNPGRASDPDRPQGNTDPFSPRAIPGAAPVPPGRVAPPTAPNPPGRPVDPQRDDESQP